MATEYLFSNNATTTLAQSVSSTATVINVASGTGALFPSPASGQAFAVTLVDAATGLTNEICYCTARSGDQLTVTRGREGTNAVTWSAGDTCANYITAGVMASWLQASSLNGYLPLTGGTLTGDTTIKGLASFSTTGNFISLGLGFLGNNGTGASIRQNDITNQYTQLLFEVDGYNSVKRYFNMRDDGTFWCGGVQFADRPWCNSTFQPIGDYATNSALNAGLATKQATGDYALNSRVTAYFAGAGSNAALTNLQGVNWTSGNTSAYVQVTANGIALAVPTTDNVYAQLINYAQPKGSYVTTDVYASDFGTSDSRIINLAYSHKIQVFTATVYGSSQTVTFPEAFSSTNGLVVLASCSLQPGYTNRAGLVQVNSWNASSANVTTFFMDAPNLNFATTGLPCYFIAIGPK